MSLLEWKSIIPATDLPQDHDLVLLAKKIG